MLCKHHHRILVAPFHYTQVSPGSQERSPAERCFGPLQESCGASDVGVLLEGARAKKRSSYLLCMKCETQTRFHPTNTCWFLPSFAHFCVRVAAQAPRNIASFRTRNLSFSISMLMQTQLRFFERIKLFFESQNKRNWYHCQNLRQQTRMGIL